MEELKRLLKYSHANCCLKVDKKRFLYKIKTKNISKRVNCYLCFIHLLWYLTHFTLTFTKYDIYNM